MSASRITAFAAASTALVALSTAAPTLDGGGVVQVSAQCNPFLAGQPAGTTSKTDVAPAQSPVPLALDVSACAVLRFPSVTGACAYGPAHELLGPEGGFAQPTAPDLGISGYTMPVCALLGVFLPDHTNPGAAPPDLDFSTAASRDFAALAPELFQTFFIGDGLRNDGSSAQAFFAPAGATRLFLGICDGFGWNNNVGAFQCTYEQTTCACGPIAVYCTAKVNSQGCTPTIASAGTPSFSGPDDFFIDATSVLNYRAGMLIWSRAPAALPFMGGTLCVAPPVKRTTLQDSAGNPGAEDCSGSYSFHMSQSYMDEHAFGVGETIFVQYWSRDPLSSSFPAGLTDALSFSRCP
ncbi:MAG: hypothetical protein L6Q99_02725 [Planctomycetes bacterium]|nr:hypothetical protein [Planctomycetota bacterium]